MEKIYNFLNSTPFKAGMAVLTAVFTIVRFGGLALPDYAQTIAVIGLALCILFFIALGIHALSLKLAAFGDERSKSLAMLGSITNKLEGLETAVEKLGEGDNPLSQALDDEKLYQSLATKYGYANELVEVECLLNPDGSARVERRVTVRAFAKYDEIDTYLMVPEMLNAEGEKTPRILEASLVDNNRTITWKSLDEIKGRTTAILKFFPPLTEGVTSTYSLVERTPPQTFMLEGTDAELDAKAKSSDPDEYFGWNINRPTKNLSIKVIFPEGFIPSNPKSQVRFATSSGFPSVQLQTEEQNRVMVPRLEPTAGGRYRLCIEVQFPLTNLIYVLRWLPQAKHKR